MLTDFRLAARSLGKSPGFSLVAILILALGIGASTAIFSVVHAVLLKPLAYHDSARLVQVQSRHPEQGLAGLAPATFADIARDARSFAAITAQQYYYVNLTKTAAPTRLTAVDATDDYFRVFDATPLLGRTWNREDTLTGATPVVVLGETFWRSQFNGRREILGETITLDDIAYTVIGVMPAGFTDVWGNASLWRPLPVDGPAMKERGARYWSVYARLRNGVTLDQAGAELTTLGQRLAQDHPQHYQGWSLTAFDLHEQVVGGYRAGLLVILGGVGCVLLITCANVAGLCIVRSLGRRKELAVRAALGASGARLLRQLLAESLVLATLGGGLGILLAHWGVAAIVASVGDSWLPRAAEIAVNGPVLAAALALTLLTGVGFGLVPAWNASRTHAHDALKEGAGRGSAGAGTRRIRAGLVVAEIALALMLLVGAGLLGRSFAGLLHKNPGMRTDQVLTLGLSLSDKRYDTADKRRALYLNVEEAVAALPGVVATGFTQTMPFTWGIPNTLVPVGPSNVDAHNVPTMFYDSVGAGFFRASGIPLVTGRFFTANDNQQGPPVVVISQATARRFFGDENPVGRRLRPADPAQTTQFEIVGVVGDVLRTGLANNEVPLQAYRPIAQRPVAFASLIVQTSVRPDTLAKAVQQAIWRVDPDQAIEAIQPVSQLVANTVAQPRLYLTLFGLFAGLALLLAAVGLYGLIAYSVTQRTREFGIRIAHGAGPREMLALVLGESLVLVGLGLAFGLAGAFAAARLLRQMLFGTAIYDPWVFTIVPLLLCLVTVAAGFISARRVVKANPLDALRAE